jgi:uncharacterized membrane protein
MLILAYFTEGVVRAWADHGLFAQLALAQTVLSLLFFAGAVTYVRAQPRPH